jgi:segregation and condensation protein B
MRQKRRERGEAERAAAAAQAEAVAVTEAVAEAEAETETGAEAETEAVVELDAARLKSLVEALVFASDKPVTLVRLKQLTRIKDGARIQAALDELAVDYKERGIALQSISGGYMFRTQSQFSSWVQQLVAGRPVRLSRAQLETLAIIAYRQPITRPEIDDIRGVDSGGTLKVLLDRQLIRILGKKEEAGRPLLYGTTKEFLDFFSLGDLRELPTLREYSELSEEHRKVVDEEHGDDEPGDEPAEAPHEAAADSVHVHQHEVPPDEAPPDESAA